MALGRRIQEQKRLEAMSGFAFDEERDRVNRIRWQRATGVLLFILAAAIVDLLLSRIRPPATDLLVLLVTACGLIGALLVWRNRTQAIGQ